MHAMDFSKLIVFHGDVSPNLAHVYVQLPVADQPDLRLQGQVRGPYSTLTRTLPASIPLQDLGPGPSALARALVPDPCSWGPGQPFLYDVDVELWHGGEVVCTVHQRLGLRRLGVHGGQLLLDSRPWTLVGCHDTSVDESPWSMWRAEQVARVARDPSEDLCRQASEEGVVLIAQLTTAAGDTLEREIHRLGKWAAVVLMEVPPQSTVNSHIRASAPTCLLAHRLTESSPDALPDWAQVGISEVPATELALPSTEMRTIPWIACRRLPRSVPLAEAAEQCRRWHADLARNGSCIGCLAGCDDLPPR
ncbi:MAG: hypothetical protein ACYC3X_21105 [Pirellulaceae bacterium]